MLNKLLKANKLLIKWFF